MPKHLNRMMEVREMTGLSQDELAAMLGTSRSSLAMTECSGRSLPGDASLYHAMILVEMNKPENQVAIVPDNLTAVNQQWKDELVRLAAQFRYQADRLKRSMDDYAQKERYRLNRMLLIQSVETVQATLIEKSKGTPWNPITEWHVKWLELQKTHTSYKRFDEEACLQNLRNQFRYNMLMKEAEEAERMAGEKGV